MSEQGMPESWHIPKAPSDEAIAAAFNRRLDRNIARRSRQQPLPPIPVSERLPGPTDCNEQGKCWFYSSESSVMNAYWVLRKPDHQRTWDTHWLPANALPLPEENHD